jgi:hypothetical protein
VRNAKVSTANHVAPASRQCIGQLFPTPHMLITRKLKTITSSMWKGKQAEQQNVRIANDIPYFMLLLISVG